MGDALTIGQLLESAVTAFDELVTLAEDVEDEWTYVMDLSAAWRERLEALAAKRGSEPATAPEQAAIDLAVDEVGRIGDPHRAIDWLSTFPQIVLGALGERP